jgi:hypothetical protein
MQELVNLRKELRKVHGSMGRVAAKAGVSDELVRKVFQGKHTNRKVIDASLDVLAENKVILANREAAKTALQHEIALVLATA